MSSGRYMGIPREEIPWFPTIDAALCTNCGACRDFCANDVFAVGETVTEVAKPLNCVVGCSSCARFCTAGAISFPTNEELIEKLRGLREKYNPKKSAT